MTGDLTKLLSEFPVATNNAPSHLMLKLNTLTENIAQKFLECGEVIELKQVDRPPKPRSREKPRRIRRQT